MCIVLSRISTELNLACLSSWQVLSYHPTNYWLDWLFVQNLSNTLPAIQRFFFPLTIVLIGTTSLQCIHIGSQPETAENYKF